MWLILPACGIRQDFMQITYLSDANYSEAEKEKEPFAK